MTAVASVLDSRKATASALAVALTSAAFYLPFSALPSPIRMPGYEPRILYVILGDPAATYCGIVDGIDGNGIPVSGAVTCSGERVPPDDPRFPRARRGFSWI